MLEANGTRLLLDCGPGVLGRLREDELWPTIDGIAITHWHLDHWGDLVPWVWGSFYLATNGPLPQPALWVQPGGIEFLEDLGSAPRLPRHVRAHVPARRVRAGHAVPRRPSGDQGESGFRTTGSRRTPSGSRGTIGRSPTPETRRRRRSSSQAAAGSDLFVCEATLLRGELDGEPRGHLSLEEAVEAFEASGAKRLLVTHRPTELPTPDEYELAFDGLELDV